MPKDFHYIYPEQLGEDIPREEFNLLPDKLLGEMGYSKKSGRINVGIFNKFLEKRAGFSIDDYNFTPERYQKFIDSIYKDYPGTVDTFNTIFPEPSTIKGEDLGEIEVIADN